MRNKNIVFSLLIATGVISGCIGDYSATTTQISKIIPATYAFVIWLPIYAGGLYLAWILAKEKTFDLGSAAPWLAISYFLSGLWVRVQNYQVLELAIIAMTLIVVLIQGNLISRANLPTTNNFRLARGLSGLLAGWLTLASAIATADSLGISYKSTSTVAIYVAFAVGFAVSAAKWIVPTTFYRGTIIWGLVAIIAQQYSQASEVAIVAGLGAIIASVMTLLMFKAQRQQVA